MRKSHAMIADLLSAELDVLYQRHGLWSVLRALAGTVLRRSLGPAASSAADLDDHMRRDIGLPETVPGVGRVEELRFEQWRRYL